MIETILVIGVIVLVPALAVLAFIHAPTSAQEPPMPKRRYFVGGANEVIDRETHAVVYVARTPQGAVDTCNRWNEREAA